MNKNPALPLTLLGALWHPAFAQNAYHDIDGSGRFEMPNRTIDTNRADEIYRQGDRRYEIYEDPRDPGASSWHRGVWRSGTVRHGGTHSLAFEACPAEIQGNSQSACPAGRSTASNVSDRVELAVDTWKTGNDDEELKLDRIRYLSFQLFIHADTEVPQNWTIIHQAWQVVPKGSPPFAVWILPDTNSRDLRASPITLLFVARNDVTDPSLHYCSPERTGGSPKLPSPGTECPIEVHRVTVERGQWNRFVIQLRPSVTSAGQLAIWQNQSKVRNVKPDAVYRGPWGYSFDKDEFDIRVGIYRRQQPRRLKLMFDDVRFGSTAASVDY